MCMARWSCEQSPDRSPAWPELPREERPVAGQDLPASLLHRAVCLLHPAKTSRAWALRAAHLAANPRT